MGKWKKVDWHDEEVQLIDVVHVDENPWSWKSFFYWLFRYPLKWWGLLKWRLTK